MTRHTCEENLNEIFGKPDRQAVYQQRVVDSLNTIADLPDAGASVSYAADLIENINSLAQHQALGYKDNWSNTYATFEKHTSGGQPRLDLVQFPFHHVIAPLVDTNALRKELAIFQLRYKQTWGKPLSKGFFPAEM